MKAALYARVSSEEQVEGYSIDAQRRAFDALIQGRDWTKYREYIDEGKSARTDNLNKRPAFKEMITDALAGNFDVLVVHKLDRFSRNLRLTLEYFDKLLKAGVAFISINEQMDFTTPSGKVHLALLGAFAQYYSDNLSQETKKGWHERRAQGLYCGALPFGAMKDEHGVPTPDTQERPNSVDGHEVIVSNYNGLVLAFHEAAKGKTDKEIAMQLNSLGYRTTGTHGARPFSKDTVKDMLRNRFYVGELPDGNGGWIKSKHQPLISLDLFEETQRARAQRANKPQTIRSDAHVYSLSGIARCGECSSTLRAFKGRGRVRMVCNGRIKYGTCSQSSTYLDVYEQQLLAYLRVFHIPEDYQEKILEAHQKLQSAYDVAGQKSRLEARLKRLAELYEWGHKTKDEYLADHAAIQRELQELMPIKDKGKELERLASFLRDITLAWEQGTQEQRNKLASCLFEAVWIKDKKVLAVTPRPEFNPFFDLQYDGLSNYVLQMRPRGDSNP